MDKKKILVVEDELAILEILAKSLKGRGFDVLTANNGQIGIELAIEAMPDVILCDIMMPIKNGYEVLQEVRSNPDTKLIPFIFLTAKSERKDIRVGMNFGADDYLTKPFDFDDLLASIDKTLKRKEEITAKFNAQLSELRNSIQSFLPHEIKTPLNIIISNANYLMDLDDYSDVDMVKKQLAYIKEASEKLYNLYDNHQLYALLEKDETISLKSLLDDIIVIDSAIIKEMANRILEKYNRIDDLIINIHTSLIKFSAFYFQKVIVELLDNAAKFSQVGTPIEIKSEIIDDKYKLTISDKGKGMQYRHSNEIEPYKQFGRSSNEQQGVGLGLYISQKLMKVAGNELVLSSSADGTTIDLMFDIEQL